MKFLPLLLTISAVVPLVSARDLLPERWFENVPGTDGSVQKSLVFRTTAGVFYRVEFSDDLVTWADGGQVYGMGHEFVVPLYEFTPPPPLPPGEDPPITAPPATHVTVKMQPSSGVAGGTVVAWKSLDDGGPVITRINGEMSADWQAVPLFAERYGAYYFFVWHPAEAAAPPSENPALGPGDTAMLEELEDHLSDMNAAVALTVTQTRNTPPPAPAPDARRFLRIHADWSVDTDGDGTPDWAEFEIAGDPSHPSHHLGNSFNGDQDGNGVPDGALMDTDEDGNPDNDDAAPFDPQFNLNKLASPRFALFPVANAAPPVNSPGPLQINDRGTVLYANGTWKSGNWTLLAEAGDSLQGCKPAALNDLDEIVGWGTRTVREDPEVTASAVAYWSGVNAAPAAVLDGDTYATATEGFVAGLFSGQQIFSNDGRVIADSYRIDWGEGDPPPAISTYLNRSVWTVPGNGRVVGQIPVNAAMTHVLDQSHFWGFDPQEDKVQFVAAGNPPAPPRLPMNLVATSDGDYFAFTSFGTSYANLNDSWKTSSTLFSAKDMSANGVAIAPNAGENARAVMYNGSWHPLDRLLPQSPPPWDGSSLVPRDTTPGGWILAVAEAGHHAALLPLRVQGNLELAGTLLTEGVGVDDFSIGSTEPGDAVQEKLWIMAPSHGGETRVKLATPIHPSCPLEISGAGLQFNGNDPNLQVSSAETEFTIKASDSVGSGTEIPLVLKLGSGTPVESVSTPISVKVMKRRTVRVRVWKVRADDGDLPSFNPTKEQLEAYLNGIYQSQINAVFDCNVETIGPFQYDTATGTDFGAPEAQNDLVEAGNGVLDMTPGFGGELDTILSGNNYVSSFNINLYIVGGANWMAAHPWDADGGKLGTFTFGAIAENDDDINDPRRCWVPGEATTMAEGFTFVAHEIGHIIFGAGHPEGGTGPAPLPGTPKPPRLMCSDAKLSAEGRRLIVKGEWDRAKEWFDKEINEKRMDE